MIIENKVLKEFDAVGRQVIIPSGVEIIGGIENGKPFYLNHTVEEIYIPEGVKEIDAKAFLGCTSLMTVALPTSLERIGEQAFFGTVLHKVKYAGTMADFLKISIATLPPADFTVIAMDGEIHFHSNNLS